MNNYNTKKIKNQEVFYFIDKHLPEKSRKRFETCGSWLEFLANKNLDKLKVYQADFCKNRFCPMCAWRSSVKDAMKIAILMDYIEKEHGKAFIFVTLTAPNVKGEDLKSEIARYNQAFKNLCKRDEVARINHGYMRKLEITHNEERDDYHPHFHVIFAVSKGYFSGGRFLKQERWLNLWRDVMGDDTITQVDVRRAKRTKDANEMAKYAAKNSDYTKNQKVFDVLYQALKGRQIITFNGLFTAANKKYKNKELDHYKTMDDTEYVWLLLYRWKGKEYVEKHKKAITQDEYKKLKKDAVDDMSI